ncbi:MAG: c-type cytochrome [Candidatus Omnitrophica bacterium]|nr:c-type cytochrome [Candidatus Omnitrophota bacterium]
MKNFFFLFSVLVFLNLNSAFAEEAPSWIWVDSVGDKQDVYFRVGFDLAEDPVSATFAGTCDDECSVYLNGKQILSLRGWDEVGTAPAMDALRQGKNVLAIETENNNAAAGLIGRLTVESSDGTLTRVATDGSWKTSTEGAEKWNQIDFDDSGWSNATVVGELGEKNLPWSKSVNAETFAKAETMKYDLSPKAKPVDNLNLLPGFKAELLYTVPKPIQGSWVNITPAPDGGFFVSDQGDAGLFHIKPAKLGDPESRTIVESLPADISSAQGLVWAFDSLYVDVNGGGRSGLYRVTDSDNNGDLDQVEKLRAIDGGGEHGPHAVILSEDGKNLYVACGNHTHLTKIDSSRAPQNWSEDLLLPRQWDARGHAKGVLAPGGWICQVTPDGKTWELISNGYRNEYDIALSPEGEMFTYDADMEWDFGAPWYRPTRICHVVSGSEYGWRSGTGKWPVYYEDSLPPVVDIGPGSPVGVVFGTGGKFPAKYQRAFFALDWTFGTIYSIHLEPEGASYKGVKEEFVSGSPLPVTDAAIGSDGAFYFTVGGRGTDSALYRVYYDGDEPTGFSKNPESKESVEARALRHELESFHKGPDPKAVDFAWPHLGSEDRFIRFAARIAIENQPVDQWKDRALSEENPQAAAVAAIALARQGDASLREDLLNALNRFDIAKLTETEALGLLRAYALCFIRMGAPSLEMRLKVIDLLDPHLPSESDNINTELVRLLVFLDAPSVIEKGLALMAEAKPPKIPAWGGLLSRNQGYGGTIQAMLDNHPPSNKINYAFMLRNVRYGWTMPQREQFFQFINDAAKYPGGASYAGFLENIRKEALDNCSPAEQQALAPITGQSLQAVPEFEIKQPKGPYHEWTLDEAQRLVAAKGLHQRNFETGRNGFYAVGCVACHRFDGAGGNIGPDLSSVGNKFSMNDLLEAMIIPSKVISDQYGSKEVTLKDGTSYRGIVVDNSGSKEEAEIEVYTSDPNAPPVEIKMEDVDSIEESTISQMPEGLVNFFNEDELLDLLAYLVSRGNPQAEVFKD